MAWDPELQNNQINSNTYTPGGYEKVRLIKLLLIVVGIFIAVTILIVLTSGNHQDKYTKSATIAARKHAPHAKVTNVKVAGGFATALVIDPDAQDQANDGSTTIFKVNKDLSMVQLAKGSSFGPLDLLRLGIPLATQSKLTGTDIRSVEQNLANQCNYSNGKIGYNGFDGSFSPGNWQIDAGILDLLEQKLSTTINAQNTKAKVDKSVICVNATQKNSNVSTNKTTFISTYTLQVQFIAGDGTITMHSVTFTNSSPRYRTYTLDGQII